MVVQLSHQVDAITETILLTVVLHLLKETKELCRQREEDAKVIDRHIMSTSMPGARGTWRTVTSAVEVDDKIVNDHEHYALELINATFYTMSCSWKRYPGLSRVCSI